MYVDRRNLLVHHHQTASRDQRVAPIQTPHMVGEKERGMRNKRERERENLLHIDTRLHADQSVCREVGWGVKGCV